MSLSPIMILMALIAVASLVLFLGALVSIIGSRYSAGMKLVWLVLALALPFVGSLLWFAIGRRDARRPVYVR